MAAYPSFSQTIQSSEGRQDSVILERATNGSLYGRALWTGAKRTFQIHHELTAAEAGTLRTFYATNRALPVDFTWAGDSQVYSVMFDAPPVLNPVAADFWRARVSLVEV